MIESLQILCDQTSCCFSLFLHIGFKNPRDDFAYHKLAYLCGGKSCGKNWVFCPTYDFNLLRESGLIAVRNVIYYTWHFTCYARLHANKSRRVMKMKVLHLNFAATLICGGKNFYSNQILFVYTCNAFINKKICEISSLIQNFGRRHIKNARRSLQCH